MSGLATYNKLTQAIKHVAPFTMAVSCTRGNIRSMLSTKLSDPADMQGHR